ncbi:hypothetical protein [Microbacterium yannicii]|uniref:hypothetical protein n=1 Tax=Microbacterium yannicii TaxID=671622 RepID=UPI0002FE52D2|nr:hypothetical protein [Microbacterium yannicii]
MALRQAREAIGAVPRWARELLGAATAVAIAVAVVTAVAASARSELLFRDGDSLVTTLVVRSLAIGQPQDWALSTVLFLPETAVLALLTLVGLGITGTLALAAIVNFVALYAVLRIAAGATARASMPVAGALLAFSAFGLLAVTETSSSRDSLEPASLLAVTTYYSATVVAVVLAVGIARRALDRRLSVVPRGPVVLIGVVAAASVLTNPLFAAWATVPLGLVLAGAWVVSRSRVALWLIGGLALGTAVGFVGRMPLAPLIANTGAGYADPSRWAESLIFYGGLVAERWTMPWGAAAVVIIVALWGWCIAATALLARRDAGAALVAACGWAMPLLVVIGAIALGTHAARYLQPIAFAPILGLVVLPGLLSGLRAHRAEGRYPATSIARTVGASASVVASIALVAVAGAVGAPRMAAAASAPDPDLDCVLSWVEQSGRTGGGQFWTVRLPKAHLDDPRALVQVDHRLRGYAWLVNRDDFSVGEVSFLVTDAQSPAFVLPRGVRPSATIDCGRYTIHDFGETALPLGPQRS